MSTKPRIYLDHAATGWPKPESVYVAIDHYSRQIGAASGRGEYRAAQAASEIVASCRRRLMRLVNADQADQIALFANGTAALNAAIFGCLSVGDHVVTTAIEHNSVLRPLEHLRASGVISVSTAPCNARGEVDLEPLQQMLTPHTKLLTLSHGSNVTGAVQDIRRVGEMLAQTDTLFLTDAAQTLGYLPIDVRSCHVDLLAAPGHKGGCGPLGTAMLYVSEKAKRHMQPTTFGGTGSISERLEMPTQFPAMFEAGNLNVPAIAGWNAGLEYLESLDPQVVWQGRRELCDRLKSQLSNIGGCAVIVGDDLPIASLVFDELDPQLVGAFLDSEHAIDVRCGLHCAALVHEPIRQLYRPQNYHGTVRISGGHFTTADQIDAAARAIKLLDFA